MLIIAAFDCYTLWVRGLGLPGGREARGRVFPGHFHPREMHWKPVFPSCPCPGFTNVYRWALWFRPKLVIEDPGRKESLRSECQLQKQIPRRWPLKHRSWLCWAPAATLACKLKARGCCWAVSGPNIFWTEVKTFINFMCEVCILKLLWWPQKQKQKQKQGWGM